MLILYTWLDFLIYELPDSGEILTIRIAIQ